MSYGVVVSFDLQNGSREDYKNAYADLDKLGLKKELAGSTRKVVLPTTLCYGEWDGKTAVAVRDEVVKTVTAAFKLREFVFELFVAVGGTETTWSHTDTRTKK